MVLDPVRRRSFRIVLRSQRLQEQLQGCESRFEKEELRGQDVQVPDIVHVGAGEDSTLQVCQLVPELVDDVERVVGRDVEQGLQDKARVLRVSEEVVARLDPLKELRDLVVVPRILRERDDGAVAEEEDRDLLDVDLCASAPSREQIHASKLPVVRCQ